MKQNRIATILALIGIFFTGTLTHAQSAKWIRGGATDQNFTIYNFEEEARFACTDYNGNLYSLSIVGNTAITADTFSRPTGGYGSPKNVLLTSHNCNGQMRFAKLISSNQTTPYGVIADDAGHIYIAVDVPHYGTSSGTTLRIGYDTTITSHTYNRVAIVQLDTAGDLKWLRYLGENLAGTFNGTGGRLNYLALDGSNNIHLIANASFGVSLTTSLTTSHTGFYDASFNSSGSLLGITALNLDTTLFLDGISLDKPSNKLFVFGSRNTIGFPGLTAFPFVGAFDIARNLIWIDTVLNPFPPLSAGFTCIATDEKGHLYATVGTSKGFVFKGDTVMNAWGVTNAVTTIAKMDTAGNAIWFRPYSSTVSSGMNRITIVPNEKVAVCGSIAGGKIIAGTDTLTAYAGEGQNAIFSTVDSAGYVQTFEQMHGSGFSDRGNAVVSDRVGNLYVVGKVGSSIYMGSAPPYTSVGGDSDYFIFKYGVDCSCTSMPVANFSYSGAFLSKTFAYTGTSTGIDSVRWSFGDGTTSTSMSPSHTYGYAGTYTVCVRVYTNCGMDMHCMEITAACASLPIANFSDTGDINRGFIYGGTVAGYDSVVWDFGDGSTDTGLSVVHYYPVNDTFQVCATVYTNCGTHTICKDVIVDGWPTMLIESTPLKAASSISVYPNPATQQLTIANVVVRTAYRLVNIVGTEMQNGKLLVGRNVVSIESLPGGIYLLELDATDGSRRVVRLMKN